MDNRRTVQERYIVATSSSSLQDDSTNHQLEVLAAVAHVDGLGGILMRVRAGQAQYMRQLMDGWKEHVTYLADRRHWPTSIKPERIAVEVMRYFMDSICSSCHGRKFTKHESAPTLTANICPACDGSGQKPIKFEQPGSRYAHDALSELQRIESDTCIEAQRKLRQD